MGRKAWSPSIGAVMILHALVRGRVHGFDIQEDTGLTSGTVYPALERMESLGLVSSTWENPEAARAEKRPPRRYYEVTPEGKAVLAEAMGRYGALAPLEIDGVLHGRGGEA